MELFNIICGVCSVVSLMVSLFTASKVIKISKTYHVNTDIHPNERTSGSNYNGDAKNNESTTTNEDSHNVHNGDVIDDHSNVTNGGSNNTFHGTVVGRDYHGNK